MVQFIEVEAAIALLVAMYTMVTFVCWMYSNRRVGSR
jgi:hypothetical protein